MEKIEIKKLLYKQKPKAKLLFIRKGIATYSTFIEFDIVEGERKEKRILFEVPVNDMGDADFFTKMGAHLLNRWIVE